MSKIKVNFKLLVAVFGLMLLAGLIPLGLQALATDEAVESATPAVDPGAPAVDPGCPDPTPAEPATEAEAALPSEPAALGEGAPTAPVNGTTFKVDVDRTQGGEIFTLDNKTEFPLQEGETVVTNTPSYNHVGSLFIEKADGSRTLIAEATTNSTEDFYEFDKWSESIESGVLTYTAEFKTYDPTAPGEGYYYAGQLVDSESGAPIVGAEASWVNLEQLQTYITDYTDSLGFVCLKIPFGINGSVHAIANGYVSDYSVPQAYTSADKPGYIYAQMIKGIECSVVSNIPEAKFHVREYISNTTIHPGFDVLTEDVVLDEVPTRMLPDGANMIALTDEFCDEYDLKHGSLYYYYERKIALGVSLYELIFEPDDNYQLDNWTIADANGEEVMQAGVEYPILTHEGPYTYTVNYFQPGGEPSQTAQTGDSVALIVAAFAGLAVACGFAARRNRKLN